jgi:multicomponent Na+:H+ antiporter subunit E
MNSFLLNILLALVWAAATARFSPVNLIVGFVIGFIALYVTRGAIGTPDYARKVRQAVGLVVFFVKELVIANVRVAYDVLTPRHHMRPGVVAVPLDAKTDAEITLLANLCTLTPGSLTLDVSTDRSTMYLHLMYIDDLDAERHKIKDGFERRVLELLR